MEDALIDWFAVNVVGIVALFSILVVALFVSFFKDPKVEREKKVLAAWSLAILLAPVTIAILVIGFIDWSGWETSFMLFSLLAASLAGIGVPAVMLRFELLLRLDGWFVGLHGKVFSHDPNKPIVVRPGSNMMAVTEKDVIGPLRPTT